MCFWLFFLPFFNAFLGYFCFGEISWSIAGKFSSSFCQNWICKSQDFVTFSCCDKKGSGNFRGKGLILAHGLRGQFVKVVKSWKELEAGGHIASVARKQEHWMVSSWLAISSLIQLRTQALRIALRASNVGSQPSMSQINILPHMCAQRLTNPTRGISDPVRLTVDTNCHINWFLPFFVRSAFDS